MTILLSVNSLGRTQSHQKQNIIIWLSSLVYDKYKPFGNAATTSHFRSMLHAKLKENLLFHHKIRLTVDFPRNL